MKFNRQTKSLIKIVNKYPHNEKLLVVPNYSIGTQILESLTRAKGGWVNFKPITTVDIAIDLVNHYLITEKIKHIPHKATFAIIDRIFNQSAEKKGLQYFEKRTVNKGIIEALTKTFIELRYNGLNSDSINGMDTVNEQKAEDISLLLSGYENFLKENYFIDNPGVITLATKAVEYFQSYREKKIFLLSNTSFYPIEQTLIEKISNNYEIIEQDNVAGLSRPKLYPKFEFSSNINCNSDIERAEWLFKPTSAPSPFNDKTINIFSGLGCKNEIREVLRRIMDNKLPADQVEIVFTDLKDYADIIYSACQKTGIPATFSDGIPYYITKTGQALRMFLLWIKNDFQEIYLRNILESGSFQHTLLEEKGAPSPSTLGHLLRISGVGWQKDRYISILKKKIYESNEIAFQMEKEGNETAEYYKNRAKNLQILKQLCKEILLLIPSTNEGKVEFPKFCYACKKFLEKNIRITNALDVNFKTEVMEQLDIVSEIITSYIDWDEALEKVLNVVSGIRIEKSNPKPGHIHISHYKFGGKTGRSNTFIVGLDENRFPVRELQDPILLDEERATLNTSLELSPEISAKELYGMASLISGLRGKVTFSYSSYDILEDRQTFPSSILLQVYRLKTGNVSANYHNLSNAIGDPVGFQKGPDGKTFIDSTDWWLSNIIENQRLKDARKILEDVFTQTAQGTCAYANRESNSFTEYDGWIKSEDTKLDPRENKSIVMSSTGLEKVAKCPFLYFVENVLKVRIPEETPKDINIWLDPIEKGRLLHEVFYRFTVKIIKDNVVGKEKHHNLLKNILQKTIEEYRQLIPPQSEMVFKKDSQQMEKDMLYFLRLNEKLGKPVFYEVVFGKESSFEIDVGENKTIHLQGKIDRIDNESNDQYSVWDYKTGSATNYRESETTKGGEQMQHCLYAVAAEHILKQEHGKSDAKIVNSGYLFPTEKGMGRGSQGKFGYPVNDEWKKTLKILLDIIKNGVFMARDLKSDKGFSAPCKFCNYIDICGAEKTRKNMDKKLENQENIMLNDWKKLKNYE